MVVERVTFELNLQSSDPKKNFMKHLNRITHNPEVMGGKPCIRGLRVTVGTIIGLMASGHSTADILNAYPYLEEEDLRESLAYAAWRVEETELPLTRSENLN